MSLPEAKYSGSVSIGSWLFRCHVLSDDRRIISVVDFFDVMEVPTTGRHHFLAYLMGLNEHPMGKSESLKSLIPLIREPILFRNNQNISSGYEATTLVEFCKLLMELRRNGLIEGTEAKTRVEIAEKIVLALANVGLVALIDEATGYQSLRPRDALQLLLDRYLRRELAAWAKRFPDEFYIELFRLKEWKWKGMKVNRPQVVGYYTKNLIYERLGPGILEELEQRNPPDEDGSRAARHHQWLTDDVGHPALAQHLHAVIGLMRASSNWGMFLRLIDRAFPRKGSNLELDLDIE